MTDAVAELDDIFPALTAYKAEHTVVNLQKLCVEIAELCLAVYASTTNEQERKVYRDMVIKLNR